MPEKVALSQAMNGKFFIYVLFSAIAGRRYIGMSYDPQIRLKEHNSGKVKSTKAYRPWKIIYTEQFNTQAEAHKREIYLKSGFGRLYLNKLLGKGSEG